VNEIAEILGISVFAVRARIKRGKNQLRLLLEKGENDHEL
jgi:DNA-directed RNA polymerase specialized sigma24 family protein